MTTEGTIEGTTECKPEFERRYTRRSVLAHAVRFGWVSTTLLVTPVVLISVPGCGRMPSTEQPLDIMGDRRESGDPLWLPESEAWILTSAVDGANLIAVSGICPYDQRAVGWCTETDSFTCPICQSIYDRTGVKYANSGPSPRGLSQFELAIADDQSVVVNRSVTTGAKTRSGQGPTTCGVGEPKLVIPDLSQRIRPERSTDVVGPSTERSFRSLGHSEGRSTFSRPLMVSLVGRHL